MADVTSRFFDDVGRLSDVLALGRTNGSLRIDLDRAGQVEHWRVELRRGSVTVSREAGPADCVVKTDASVFEDLARGRANAMAATLRGQLLLEGDPTLLIRFQRLFPAPTRRRMTLSARSIGRRRG